MLDIRLDNSRNQYSKVNIVLTFLFLVNLILVYNNQQLVLKSDFFIYFKEPFSGYKYIKWAKTLFPKPF